MRRFKIGENKNYDEYYTNYFRESNILHSNEGMPNAYSINLSDEQGLTSELFGLQGIQEEGKNKGMYWLYEEGKWYPSVQKSLEVKQKELTEKFLNFCQSKVNEGFRRPEKMTSPYLEMQMKIWARADVLREEIRFIKKRLQKIENKKSEIREKEILAHGPIGSGSLRNGILAEIDGQKVSQNKDGILFIDEPKSPYYGLGVVDYREFVARPWANEKKRLWDEQDAKIKSGELALKNRKIKFHPPLPKYPKNCKNYLKV